MKSKSTITNILLKELERNKNVTIEYELELTKLPKGTIVKRKIGNGTYYYLTKREGEKVVTEYLGKFGEDEITELEKKIAQRRRVEKYLKELRIEKKEIERALK